MGPVPDPYLLPNGVLRNKLRETDAETLATREAQYVAARTLELKGRPHSTLPSTMARLQDIHHHLFQDVYEWAGKFRRVNLAKAYFEGENEQTKFVSAEYITSQAAEIDRWIQEHGHLLDLSAAEFNHLAAELFVLINDLHPFREGNGRVQRYFLQELAITAGHQLSFDVVTRERMIVVSIQGALGDVEAARRLFDEISDPERVASLRKALTFLKRTPIRWNDIYVSTTVAGEIYRGRIVGRAGNDFMMRVDAEKGGRIIVGNRDDLDKNIPDGDEATVHARKF